MSMQLSMSLRLQMVSGCGAMTTESGINLSMDCAVYDTNAW